MKRFAFFFVVAGMMFGLGLTSKAFALTQASYCTQVKNKTVKCRQRSYYKQNAKSCKRSADNFALSCTAGSPQDQKNPSGYCIQVYQPVCGQPPFYCPPGMNCAMVLPDHKTYSNICTMTVDGAYLVHNGECKE